MKKDQIIAVVLIILVSGVSVVLCNWKDELYNLGTYDDRQSFAPSSIYIYCQERGTEDCQILGNALEAARQHFEQQKEIDALQTTIEETIDLEAKAILLKRMEIKKEEFSNHGKTYLATLTSEELEKLNESKERLILLTVCDKGVERECKRIREKLDPQK